MEHKSDETSHDKNENLMGSEVLNSNRHEIDGKDVLSPVLSPPGHHVQVNMADQKVEENVLKDPPSEDMWAYGEVNMEASISTDDVIRAGGFGARDDISSFLPVASDSTDFEATIRDARDYEEPQGKICRPGLGWTEATEAE
ncbi:hypothetical protein F2P56_009867 [Juglans regia]|uniref:Uncharacterized protein LOC109008388 isoform X1 n=3 Tax=Juglans regia TaxID=51240 RepID=A0A2I4GJD0_JUGRE|nr:uncharacterized protein LOC109008388 isoform X1 [Juglans regia]XP_018844003.2 uncharacterized protein LOC109008388 isoform X1 [Juglans regia]XP_018844005.2 uncharacterized protein LOC109008388 isoform X1 [Juglans regia]XP_035545666.1 uncharacterized protein LOC109008388 isoform X1 [Juglans regia]KAF5473242.1 hypothetical protein F2P56_009867 [Juglans regia]